MARWPGLEPAKPTRMIWCRAVPCFSFVLLCVILLAAGLADWWVSGNPPSRLRTAAYEVQAACRDGGTQWMVVVCLVSYFGTFVVLASRTRLPQATPANPKGARSQSVTRHPSGFAFLAFLRGNFREPDFWLVAFVVLVLLRYASAYDTASKSLHVVVLLTGIVIGKAIAFWSWLPRSRPAAIPNPAAEERGTMRVRGILHLLVFLLAAAALWQTDYGMSYQYLGQQRWKGLWENPNLYGLLMGSGVVLAVGLFRSGSPSPAVQRRGLKAGEWLRRLALLVAALVCGIGLLRSFSRGAWLGTVCALAYFGVQSLKSKVQSPKSRTGGSTLNSRLSTHFRRNWLPASAILISGLVIAFWPFRHSQSPWIRRVFSPANVNDFSWRNRVTVWQGSFRMALDHPVFGVGWGRVEKRFAESYRAARLEDTAAVQLNDYFTLANSAGLPVLFSFAAYVFLSLRQPGRSLSLRSTPQPGSMDETGLRSSLSATAVLLLIGFWFDAGLFKLPTSVLFWLVLQLANSAPSVQVSNSELRFAVLDPPRQCTGDVPTWASLCLRWLAVILATVAIGQTAWYLVPLQLEITPRTLKLARRHLVQQKEVGDFDSLSTNSCWPGKKLKTLLQHVELANYNRELVNWKLDDDIYRQFVLSAQIDPARDGDMNWRRPLWESFYPRIRKENSLEAAAETIVRHLRERVTIVPGQVSSTSIADIWRKQITDERGFAAIYVAALRSAGVPARLGANGQAEFYTGNDWKAAPTAVVGSLLR